MPPRKLIWILALVFVLSAATAVSAKAEWRIYLPVAHTDPAAPPPTEPVPAYEIIEIRARNDFDLSQERVSIENTTGSAVDMSGWTLNDENGNRYTFPDGYSLGRRSILRVWTQVGVNSAGGAPNRFGTRMTAATCATPRARCCTNTAIDPD